MKFTSDRARYTFEVLLSNGMKEEEALLFIARYHGKGEELARASEDNVSSHFFGIYRTSKKEGFDLLGEVCLPQSDLERRLILDDKSVDNGKKKTPDNWFKYWSKVKDGRVMASMGDLYQSFKLIKKMRESGTTEEQAIAQRYLNSLLEDFDWPGKKNWLVSSTRLIYSGNSLDTRIIHHYQSNRLELTKEVILEVPIYRGIEIEDVFSSDRGSAYLQALLDTEDDPEMIISVLEFISGKRRNEIKSWTAIDKSNQWLTRSQSPNRAAGFSYNVSEFHVYGNYNTDYLPACSRGVLVTP